MTRTDHGSSGRRPGNKEMTMFTDEGGMMWLIIDVMLVAALAIGIAYGLMMWRTRRTTPRLEQQRDAATREGYAKGSDNS